MFKDLVRRGKQPLQVGTKDVASVPETAEREPHFQSSQASAHTEGDVGGSLSDTNTADTAPQEPDDAEPTPPSKSTYNDGSKGVDSTDKSPTKHNLWAEAYETIKADSEHTGLLTAFEKYLEEDADTAPDAKESWSGAGGIAKDSGRLKLIQKLAKRKLEKLPEAQLTFSVGKRTIVVRQFVRKAIKVVSKFKDVISSTISAEPHAALAWAGVMAVLPLLENTFQQDEDAANGLRNILFLLIRYQAMEEGVLLPEFKDSSQSEKSRQLLLGIRTKFISIYAQVYVYEIHFVLQYARSKVSRALRNAVRADSWKQMWDDIETTSQLIDQGIKDRISAITLKTWGVVDDIMTSTVNIESLQQATLAAVQTGNQAQFLLSLPFAGNAVFDSAEILGSESSCLNGTQRRILNEIQNWAENSTGEMIFWLHGMAGTGKTSVALTVANALSNMRPFADGDQPPHSTFLGASFFFKQGDASRNGTKAFFPTLARCLAEAFPDLKSHIVGAITERLAIGTKAPPEQLDRLIFRPLSVLDKQTFLPIRLVVVVDALDECIKQTEAEELLDMLMKLEDLYQVQLRVLITSRRDSHILGGFSKLSEGLYRSSILEKIRPPVAGDGDKDDITLYLIHTLAKIAKNRGVSQHWIDEVDIGKLCKKADGLFIYAATACRFLDADDFTDNESRQERLDQIFDNERETDAPQQKVDEIYLKVLSFPDLAKSSQRTKERVYTRTKQILGFIAVFFEPVSVSSLGHLLSLEREKLDEALKRLHSVVDIPRRENAPLGLVHLSFRDFLLSEERSKQLKFRVEEKSMHRAVFERCLELMSNNLRQDMCNLYLPGRLASEVSQSEIEQNVPPHLQYACRYWVDHLAKLDDGQQKGVGLKDNGEVHTFLLKSFLYWLEAMSLIREMSTAVLIVNRLQTLVDSEGNPSLSSLVYDAKRFVLSNRWIISHAPLQIYCSALIFSPMASRPQFGDLIPPWITWKPMGEDWTSELCVLEGHTNRVRSVAFSPSDNLIVSGSEDGTTRLWDFVTGTELFKFDDSAATFCVAFSPDGKSVASGSQDGVVRVREFASGRAIDLTGHSSYVTGVAFSPKSSSIVASVSQDDTLRIWNTDKGCVVHICVELYSSWAIAFSPDGKFVAVGSGETVMLWGVEKGELIKTFKGCRGTVMAVAIATDGETVASSDEVAFRLWDLATGRERYGHYYGGPVNAIAFSPIDGNLVAIGNQYDDVELRRADTWELIGNFGAADSSTWGVSFSRDGRSLAAGCQDHTVRLWDTTTNTTARVMNNHEHRHEDPVDSVEFLPGADNIVSTTSYMEVTLWDVDSGVTKKLALEPVRRVYFSPGGRFVALTLINNTLQIWDQSMTSEIVRFDNPTISHLDYRVIFSPGGDCMAIASDSEVRIMECTAFAEIASLDISRYRQRSFTFSPNGRVAGWFARDMFHLQDLAAKKELVALPYHGFTHKVIFSPNGELVAFHEGGLEHPANILLLEVATGKQRRILAEVLNQDFVVFHPESHLVATARKDISVWETASGSKKFELKIVDALDGARRHIVGLAISTTGKLVAASHKVTDTVWTIQLWDTTGIEIGRFGTEAQIRGLSFSSDSRYFESTNGRLPLPPPLPDQDATSADVLEATQRCLYVGRQWVVQGFDNLLWLPPAYRASSSALRGETLVLGHGSGLVTLKFDLAQTPISRRPRGLPWPNSPTA